MNNLRYFLDTIAWSELGADLLAVSDNGYNVIVGSTPNKPLLFSDYSDHPRQLIRVITKNGVIIPSTAAGRYQILSRYFDNYKPMLQLPDFGHESQDKIAIQLIKECRAIDLINKGEIEDAIAACSSRWASLPGAGYKQHEHKIDQLIAVYEQAGGTLS